jgi:cytoskeletal protein CcmA (bactofilin family)
MGDTEIMRKPMFGKSEPVRHEEPPVNDEPMTESQVIPFKDVPESVKREEPATESPKVSVIGESLHFKGELSAGEDLIIEGTVEGKINQGKCCLTLRPNGKILADVNATKIFVEGTVKGDLRATVSVTIRESGDVTGNVVAPRVAIDEGAKFNGSVDMRDPGQKS